MKIEDSTIASLAADLAAGRTTSAAIVEACIARISALDRAGPRLNAVIALNPDALADSYQLDIQRRAGRTLGPLHGIPILLKDNIEAAGMPTTAGSLALARNDPGRDSPVAAALKAAGAIILGKTNLSEWANFRSLRPVSGWSAVGGLTRNPHALDRTACGSSSGSGAAVAAGFAPAAIGTETNGSLTCPAAMTGLVGLKPTLGLIPADGIVPVSGHQDTPGPMTRTVRDAAILLSVLAGGNTDYAAALDPARLGSLRIGVLRGGWQPELLACFETALGVLERAGATLVEADKPATDDMAHAAFEALLHEFRADLNAYLATTRPDQVPCRTLADLIAFNTANRAREMPFFGQELFEMAEATPGLDDPAYQASREAARQLAREGIAAMLASSSADLLVAISDGPAWISDTVWGDHYAGQEDAAGLPAIAGYPHLTVPMGTVRGLPVGISFIAAAHAEQLLLDAGHAYEQASDVRLRPDFRPTADAGPEVEGAASTTP